MWGRKAAYQVRLKNKAGALVAVFTHDALLGLHVRRVVNGVASHELSIDATVDTRCDLFAVDGQVEVWRKPAGQSWYREYEGFHRTGVFSKDDDGREVFTSRGYGYQDLLTRRIVAYAAGSAGAAKSGVAETVIKAFVDENAGPGAGTGRPITGLSVQADAAGGESVNIRCAYDNLLDVCQRIASIGGGDFDVVGTGAATWEFRWYAGQRGTDRRTTIVFSTAYGNMSAPELTLTPAVANAVLVMGGGQGAARTLVWRPATLPTDIDRRELARDARDTTTTATLNSRGDVTLDDCKAINGLAFGVAQMPSYQYGVHYTLGDLVTASYRGVSYDLKIKVVTITMGNPDTVSMEFENV